MLTVIAAAALAGQAADTQVVVVQTQEEPAVAAEPPMDDRSHVAVGFSFGMSSGFGPSIGIPVGRHHRIGLTALPVVVGDTALFSGGLRLQHYLGSNPRTRLYLTESVGVHAADGALTAVGAGAGIETRKAFGTGRVGWFEIDLTVLATEGTAVLLPLPQAGVAWEF